MADHSPLIEQIEGWRDRLMTVRVETSSDARVISAAVREMNEVVADLRRESDGEVAHA